MSATAPAPSHRDRCDRARPAAALGNTQRPHHTGTRPYPTILTPPSRYSLGSVTRELLTFTAPTLRTRHLHFVGDEVQQPPRGITRGPTKMPSLATVSMRRQEVF